MAESYPSLAAGQRITASLLRSMQPQFARKTADTSRAATTTLADDPHLTWQIEANAVYNVSGWIKYDATTAADANFGFTVPAGADGEWMIYGVGHSPVITFTNTGTALLDNTSSRGYPLRLESVDLAGTRNIGGLGVGITLASEIRATVRTSSTAGTLALKWAQLASDATAMTVYTDSMLRLDRLA